MVGWPRTRRSAITFDVGTAGTRAFQFQRVGQRPRLCDVLQIERNLTADVDQPAAADLDAAQLQRLIGQGCFSGTDVAVVLSPPTVQFSPMRLPDKALAQPPERVEQALRWEVAQESRRSADELELRFWQLPAARAQQANVMAVVMPARTAVRIYDLLAQEGLHLRRLDVAPCALVRTCCCAFTPAEDKLWGVLDLGLAQSTLTVVVGSVPTYIRSVSVHSHEWTRKLAQAFEVAYPVAEKLKRENGVTATTRGFRDTTPPQEALKADDLAQVVTGVLRDSLHTLAQEIGRCFSYVMQSYPEHAVSQLVIAGGGANLGGLDTVLGNDLGIPVHRLDSRDNAGGHLWSNPLLDVDISPTAAAAAGGALLDLEAA